MQQRPHHEIFVCGRLCLFGEHSDWAGQHLGAEPGRTIVVGTNEGLYATAAALVEPLDVMLAEARAGGFMSYIAGTAYRVALSHHVGGLHLNNHHTTLPLGKGLSSSAAICVLVARAFNLVYDLKLTTRGEMELAYLGEVTTPSKCGRMDQACAFGPVPVLMTFDGDVLHVQQIKLKAPLYLVVVNLGEAKDTTRILKALQAAYPQPRDAADAELHELLGRVNASVVARAVAALEEGDVQALGCAGLGRMGVVGRSRALMVEAQAEFDARAAPLCPDQLQAPALHRLLAHETLSPLVWGGKGVGSQGDGSAQLLCRGPAEQAAVIQLVSQQLGLQALTLTLLPPASDA